jgi:hypothetical protein
MCFNQRPDDGNNNAAKARASSDFVDVARRHALGVLGGEAA